jgi:hypothetical protein
MMHAWGFAAAIRKEVVEDDGRNPRRVGSYLEGLSPKVGVVVPGRDQRQPLLVTILAIQQPAAAGETHLRKGPRPNDWPARSF